MASFPNPTFGCGNFLPGFGPFSIPEYDGPKNPVGVPGGGEGISFAPDMEEVLECRCVLQCPPIQVFGTPYQVPCTDPVQLPGRCYQQRITYTFEQECGKFEVGGIQQCADVNTYCSTQRPPHPGAKLVFSKVFDLHFLGALCPDRNDECTGDCNPIVVVCVWEWFVPFDPGDGGGGDPLDPEDYFACIDMPSTRFPCDENGQWEGSGPFPCTCFQQKRKCVPQAGGPFNTLQACKHACIDGSLVIDCPEDHEPSVPYPSSPVSPRPPGYPWEATLVEQKSSPVLSSSKIGSGLRERKAPEIPPKNILEGKLPYYMPSLTAQIQDPNAGPFDPDIDILTPQQTEGNAVVKNRLDVRKNIFNRNIGTGLDYTIRNSNLFKDWNSGYGYKVTPQTVIKSIDPHLLNAFREMKKIDGSSFTRNDIYNIFRTRILDGTINSYENTDLRFDPNEFFKLARKTKDLQIPNIKKSTNPAQNQGAALAWLEFNSISADINAPPAEHINKIMNWKFLPTDINMYIPVSVGGEIQKLFVKNAGTFSPYPTLIVQDGDYIIVGRKKLFCNTERDHAIIPSEGATQTAIKLLGGTGHINLTVSSPATSRIEYSNNLNLSGEDPREQMIFAKLEASTIVTEKTPQSLLYKTKATYKVVDTDTAQGLSDFNDYIKYKFFHRTFTMSWDDLFLDHLAVTGEYQVESEDVIFNAPKTNKNIPLLTRRIPYYIGIFPTNRQKYLPFNEKSVITQLDLDTNIVERRLKTVPTIDPDFWEDGQFVQAKLGWPEGNQVDIFGKTNIQNIISEYNPSATIYKEGYKVDGVLTTGTNVRRNKKFLRTLYDIVVNNLDQNYVLERQGIGKGVYWFDVFSRFTLTEFNRFTFLSNASTLIPTIAKGLFNNIKIFSPLKYAGEVATNKTCLLRLKEGASADTFPQIKRTNITKKRFVYSTTGVTETNQALTDEERTEAEGGRTAQTLY